MSETMAGINVRNDHFTEICDSRDREVWLEARNAGVGASDSPILCGVSTYGSWLSLAATKTGQMPEFEGNEITEAGNKIEPFIAEWALEEMHKKGMPYGIMIRSNDVEWLQCTPDWVIFEDDEKLGQFAVPFQIKNTHWKAGDWDDGVPEAVMVQCQHEIMCFGAPWGYVAVLLTGNRLRWTKIMPDMHLQEQILDQGADFWSRLTQNLEMPVDGSEHTRKALFAMHPSDNGETIALDAALMEDARRFDELKIEAKTTEEEIESITNRLKAAMGKHTWATFPDSSGFSFKTQDKQAEKKPRAGYKSRVLRRQKASQ